ncbi:hypothetical protein A3A79_00330 [Candidatus Gottesmanbacteria bacterium RIFCSPLOWO2_01_FULL_43_11b]|uniref:SpaA-like prealbumin fold domain-containing protein n=1 Tax=Candidatus Gottesmanbacteria bacterium RIFCSPLOWO2_01_FULL_43_11b TaxID=1798392 RepID=A0A1F6AFW0_9BACT|nr:MAG: hypothetical protein A3A79_00330 [Candidatus Gottesmanbacteria bacterium RIFCSPLOWO2_01_FULL_43_11b]
MKFFHKSISLITGLLLVLQSLVPALSIAPNYVFAQDAEEQVQEQVEPTAAIEPSPEPTFEPTPTEEVLPTPTEEVSPTPETSEPPHETSPPEPVEGDILDGVSSTIMPTPQVSSATTEEGQVNAILLHEVEANSLDLDSVDPKSATLSTDKADYAPTDTVVITGTNFDPNTNYTLSITSGDEPAYSFQTAITTDGEGSFVYAHQLDGTYRPNYQVTVTAGESTVASTTFTDSPPSGCFNDSAGANDEPGQKDLSKACVDYTGLPTSIDVDWNWDEIAWSGANTGDACSLFDTDNDGFANYSLCVRVSGDPATYQNHVLFSCTDTKADRCSGSAGIANTSSCTASVQSTDPFLTGDEYPDDTGASCTINMADVGGATASLIDVCSYPSQQPNSDPSDCIFASTASQTGLLEVRKALSPTTDSGLFNLSINSITYAFDAGHNGTTGEKVVDTGNHTFGETQGTGTILSDYTTTVQCLNAAGAQVTTTGTNPWTVNIANNADIVCTITNTLNQGTLIVEKVVVNDNGGTLLANNFSFQVDGGTAQPFEADGHNEITVSPGTYDVTEPAVSGYSTTYDNCTDVVVPNGGSATCIITNNDQQAYIIVDKTVVNDNGGLAVANDFLLTVDGNPVSDGATFAVNPGAHSVGETPLPGYTAGAWGGDCDVNAGVTVNLGETKTCTITNDDQAGMLIVKKIVTNDNGGTLETDDFTFEVNGGGAQAFEADGQNDLTVDAGSYTITEPTVTGYETSYDNCTRVAVTNGGSATCTITNDDIQPLLTVTKIVTNDNGGNAVISDFPLFVNATQVTSGVQNGFNAGSYVVSETSLTGYTGNVSGNCAGNGSVTLAIGDVKECTITNDDVAPTITLIKLVKNDNGGTADVGDFILSLGNGNVTSGVQNTVNANTAYEIDEAGPLGYEFVSIAGDPECPLVLAGNVTADEGKNITCTITNTDQPATLTLIKNLPNDNGGTAGDVAFNVYINTVASTWGSHILDAGSYTISEDTLSGYTAGIWSGDCDENGNVTLLPGDQKTCEITNDDEASTLIVKKIVVGGSASANDFTFQVNGGEPNPFEADGQNDLTLDAGTYTVTEPEVTGYSVSYDNCTEVVIPNGGTETCTITNTRDTGGLTVHKLVDSDADGVYEGADAEATVLGFDWGFDPSDTPNAMGASLSLDTDSYNVFESGVTGYHSVGWFYTNSEGSCENPAGREPPAVVDVTKDTTTNITFCNTRDLGTITVLKNIDWDESGQIGDHPNDVLGDTTWTWDIESGQQDIATGESRTLATGSYTITEDEQTYYQLVGWVCDNDTSGESNSIPVDLTQDGQNITCTFTNTPDKGTVTVNKDVDSDGDGVVDIFGSSDWIWELGSLDYPTGTTVDVVPGDYSLTEFQETDYHVTDLTCDDISLGAVESTQVSVEPGQDITCTFTNTRDTGGLTVHKMVDGGDGNFVSADPGAFTWGFDFGNTPNAMGSGLTLVTGSYNVYESEVPGYHLTGWFYTNDDASCEDTDGGEPPAVVDVTNGDTTEITFCNVRDTGDLRVNKFVDTDGDGDYDSFNPEAFKWGTESAVLAATDMGSSQTLITGTYDVFENDVLGYQFTGWYTGDPRENQFSCDNPEFTTLPTNLNVTGEGLEITLCNKLMNPVLTISKTNDAGGDKNPGDSVVFTITVEATQSAAYNVFVTDLPDGGFTYRAGSWTATKNGIPFAITEPVYASPGLWSIGDMSIGDVVVLTYIADIASDITPGLYKDLVWAFGCIFDTDCVVGDGNDVLATAIDPGFVSENYAGTGVNIVKEQQNGSSITVEQKSEVLGASTELPATGANAKWLLVAVLLFLSGVGFVSAGRLVRRYYA